MDLRLIYEGPLGTEKSKVVEAKHAIRRALRLQLLDHVRRRPALSHLTEKIRGNLAVHKLPEGQEPDWAAIGRKYHLRGEEFVPIVVGAADAVCHLDILFLRREHTDSLILKPKDEYGGDLDNRLKIFLDALRVPQEEKEVPVGIVPEPWEQGPFYCLLEDDSLITKLCIEADVLAGLHRPDEHKHVKIILTATLKITSINYYNLLLAGAS